MRNTSFRPDDRPVQTGLFSPSTRVWCATTDGGPLYYSLVISARAKKVWLKIRPEGGLEVVVPRRTSLPGIEGIIREREGWIRRHLDARKDLPGPSARPVMEDGAMLPYLGERYRLTLEPRGGYLPRVRLSGDRVLFPAGAGSGQALRDAVVRWYRDMAGSYIRGRVDALKGGLSPARITIKDQKSRWGSCSTAGNLNFSWRLVMAPPPVVDYLVVHELTHLERLDHSKAFWRKVEARCPGYREHTAWLKENGPALHAW